MDKKDRNLDDWSRLYSAAVEFRNLAPWNWMTDEQLFGVENPATGDTGYCCVLGAAGEVFGMAVYRGPAGYALYRDIRRSRVVAERDDLSLYEQDSLFSEFTTRDELEAKDLKIISELGLEFRGGGFPFFRSYRPGMFPWHLDDGEVKFMADCYDNATVVANEFSTNPLFLKASVEGQILMRVSDAAGNWRNEWRAAAAAFPQQVQSVTIDPGKIMRANQAIIKRQGTWELGYCYLPTPIQQPGSRPFMPLVVMLLIQQSGYVLGQQIIKPGDNRFEAAFELLTSVIHKNPNAPETLLVGNPQAQRALAAIGKELAINVEFTQSLPAFEEAKAALIDHLRQGGGR